MSVRAPSTLSSVPSIEPKTEPATIISSAKQIVPPPSDPEVNFDVPSWAGRPPDGMHLDVMKGDKLVQKLMIDEKRCYYFGRMPKLCDFTIDHGSCSRVHAALVYHTKMNRFFIVDLGSSHGTFIGATRLEPHLATNIPVDAQVHFGASTRMYTLRARPSALTGGGDDVWGTGHSALAAGYLGKAVQLPEKDEELLSLTEYNTALNRRIANVAVPEEPHKVSKHSYNVSFMDEDQVINPEDIDPSVGRFRNLVSTVVIPSKRESGGNELSQFFSEHPSAAAAPQATATHSALSHSNQSQSRPVPTAVNTFGNLAAPKIGLSLPNPAPDVDLYSDSLPPPVMVSHAQQLQQQNRPPKRVHDQPVTGGSIERLAPGHADVSEHEPRRKKYAKEAWPGKKPNHLLLA